jgi:predicted nucleic acid-binding protein
MARKIECYADTSAFIAFLDRSDSHHPFFRRLFSDPPPLFTSSLVVAEGHGRFLRRYDPRRALQFLQFLDELPVLVVWPFGAEELMKCKRLLKKYADQSITLADAHGLVLMGEHRTGTCWSIDRHLSLTGVPLVV